MPTLLFSEERRAIWQKMAATRHPAMVAYLAKASSGTAYPAEGEWETYAYQFTKDASLAKRAIERQFGSTTVPSANTLREMFIAKCIAFDWLRDAMTETQRLSAKAFLLRWADECVKKVSHVDSDQTVGMYFGFVLVDHLFGTNYLGKTGTGPYGPIPIASNRDDIARYCTELSAGGIWCESSQYNVGTVTLLAMGYHATKAFHPFPEVEQFLRECRTAMAASLTPDLKSVYQWGDEQDPQELRLFNRIITLSAVGAHDLAEAFIKVNPATFPRYLLFCNPYDTTPTVAPKRLFAKGQGIFLGRTDTDLFGARFCPVMAVHHNLDDFGDVQWYRNGETVYGHPIGYGYADVAMNQVLLYGRPSQYKREVLGTWEGTDWQAIRGRSNGSPFPPTDYRKLPEYASHTCDIVWLESEKAIVYRDTITVKDPATIPAYANHLAVFPSTVPIERLFHCPEQPAANGADTSYETPAGQLVRIRRLTEGQTLITDNGDLVGTHPREDARWPYRQSSWLGKPGDYEMVHVVSMGEPDTKLAGNTVTVGKTVVTFGDAITVGPVVEPPPPSKPMSFVLTITDEYGKQTTVQGIGVVK